MDSILIIDDEPQIRKLLSRMMNWKVTKYSRQPIASLH